MSTARKTWLAAAIGAATLAWVLPAGAEDRPDVAVSATHSARAARRTAAAPPLTVRRRVVRVIASEPIVADDGFYDGQGLFRRWDDPRLYTFYGWRLGGDNFYGDQAGDPITRGNASLGAIAGYGPASGGYGGPHFDSVGGFHNGPGPEAQEAADYATGSIWQPSYDRPIPRYPTLKQQVASLDSGLVGTGQVSRRLPHEHGSEGKRGALVERDDDRVGFTGF